MDKKISIVMPVYKTEEYVERAILSVVHQTYSNYELICVNDCTPDNAAKICKDYAMRYPEKIKLINSCPDGEIPHKNRGQEAARNRGLEAISGEYVIFLDSDDEIDSNTLYELNKTVSSCDVDVMIFSYSKIINGNEFPAVIGEQIDGFYSVSQFIKLLLADISLSVLCCIGAKMYNTAFLRNNNLSFNKKYKYNEDIAFILESLKKSRTLFVARKPYYKYLIRESGSTMSSYKPNMFITTVRARELIKELFISYGLWDIEEYKYRYYHELLALINGCLINEIKYGTKDTYKEEFVRITQYNDFNNMNNCLLKNSSLISKQHVLVLAMKYKCRGLVRIALERTL